MCVYLCVSGMGGSCLCVCVWLLLFSCSLSFKPRVISGVIKEVLLEHLEGKVYDQQETSNWTRDISAKIKDRLKGTMSPAIIYSLHLSIYV
jgi:hypothetical protein